MKQRTHTDHELLALIKSGDNEAFETLYYRYFEQLARFACKRLHDEAITEELVQDVFVDLWKKRAELNPEGNAAGLLFAMLRNKALHALRARMIEARHIEVFAQLNSSARAPDENEQLYAKQLQEKMKRAVNNLSPQCREAFTLSRYEQLPYKDIAERMHISVNTVEKHIGKALHILRNEFQEHQLPVILLTGLLELALQR